MFHLVDAWKLLSKKDGKEQDMDIDEALLDCEDRMIKAVADFERYMKGVRTGEASTEIVEGINVDIPAYGGVTNLKSVAVISKQDARMLVIKPFDPNTIKDIDKAIQKSDIGITPNNDGKIIRLAFPPMSEERRQQTVKALKERLEQHKVSIRNVRKDAIKQVDGAKGQSGVSEDNIEAAREEIQSLTKKYESQLDQGYEKKSKQIMTV